MRETLDRRNLRALARSGGLGTLGGRLDQAQPAPPAPPHGRQPQAGRGHAIIVAAVDSTDKEKKGADVVCDGTSDQVQINEALAALAASSSTAATCFLCSGGYVVDAPIEHPGGIMLTGPAGFAATIGAMACNAIEMTNVGYLRSLYIYNYDDTDTGTCGIKTTQSAPIIHEFGDISDCSILFFDRQIQLQSCRFYVHHNVLWNGFGSRWGVWADTAYGRQWIVDNTVLQGNGFHLEGDRNHLRGNLCDIDIAHTSLELASSYGYIGGNDFDAGSIEVSGDRNRVRDNVTFGNVTVPGNWNRFAGNGTMHSFAISGNNNRHYDNDYDPFTFSDTGITNRAYLGSTLDDWNWT